MKERGGFILFGRKIKALIGIVGVRRWIISGLIVGGTFFMGLFGQSTTAQAHFLSYDEEYEIGKQAIDQYRQQYSTYHDDKVDKIMNFLIEANPQKDVRKFREIEVSNVNVINAYSFPAGWIVVTKKMVNFCDGGEDDSILAFIIGHEYGHFINEDFLRKYDKQFGTNLLFQIGAAFSNYNETIDGAIIANLAQDYITQLNSRQMSFRTEQQADEKAFDLLMSFTKISTGGGAVFFSRCMEEDQINGIKDSFAYPHSKPEVRLKRILERMKKESNGRVEFKQGKLYIDGMETGILPPSKDGKLTGIERTYILAGNIAKAISYGFWNDRMVGYSELGNEMINVFANGIEIMELDLKIPEEAAIVKVMCKSINKEVENKMSTKKKK